jgi:uncharacterized protein YcfJ
MTARTRRSSESARERRRARIGARIAIAVQVAFTDGPAPCAHRTSEPVMKRIVLVPLFAAATAIAPAHTVVENATVVAVEPQYEQVRAPRQECSRRLVDEPRRVGGPHYGGAVVVGVAGALIGNLVGRGHGREAATAVGAVIGAFTGHHLANRDRWERTEVVTRELVACRDVEDVQSRLVGYQVTYDLNWRQFTSLLHDAPGRYLPVRVSVEPVGR